MRISYRRTSPPRLPSWVSVRQDVYKRQLQPIAVRPRPMGGYSIVAGERRWRASRMAGLTEVPVVIKDCLLYTSLSLP